MNDFPSPPPGKTGWPWIEKASRFSANLPQGRNWPLVSIVTPSFNQAPYLESTIRSLLLQGYPRLEYIIVDGGSTDGSVDIIKKYEPWLAYWVSEKDNGQSHAINKGFARARGDILAWLNSDDQYCQETLWKIAQLFVEHPEIDLIYGDCEMMNAEGRVIDYLEGRTGGLADLFARDFIPQPSTFFRRRAWETVGGLDETLRYILDFDLWIRMMMGEVKSFYVPAVFSRFRWHGVSKSNRDTVEFGFEYLGLLDRLFEEVGDPKILQMRLKGYHHAFSIVASGYERFLQEGNNQEHDILRVLEQWKVHLDKYGEGYEKDSALWAESLYRIGQSYCLHGYRNEGRRAFVSALRIRKSAYRPLCGWIAATLGTRVYRWYTSAWRIFFSFLHHARRQVLRKGRHVTHG